MKKQQREMKKPMKINEKALIMLMNLRVIKMLIKLAASKRKLVKSNKMKKGWWHIEGSLSISRYFEALEILEIFPLWVCDDCKHPITFNAVKQFSGLCLWKLSANSAISSSTNIDLHQQQ